MAKYILLAEKGTTIPRYQHDTFESAKLEAVRLHNNGLGEVKILKVVAEVKKVEVPVTKL